MSSQVAIIAALVAGFSSASPLAARAGPGSVDFVNSISEIIPYALTSESGLVQSGSFAPGSTTNLPMSPDKSGYSLKLAAPGGNPNANSGILQFEYTYVSDDGGFVSYEFSCVNCNPDPYHFYNRTITPADIGSMPSCGVERCDAGVDSSSCEFITPDNSIASCSTTGGVVLTASIS